MIYIDPPYNTGKDFVYKDNYKDNLKNYKEITGQVDSEGNNYSTNAESNGRYHSDWLNMMYPRLRLARNLLKEDGVIFISIDDNEQSNLKKICDEIFGEDNFVADVIWQRAYSPVNLKKHFSENHDFILVYAKNIDSLVCNGLKRTEVANSRYMNPDNDSRGVWQSSDISVGPAIQEKVYEIITPSGRSVWPSSGYCWRLSKERFQEFLEDNRIWFGHEGKNTPRLKRFLSEVKEGMTPLTIWKYEDVGHSQEAKQRLKELFDGKAYFDYPKPIGLINRMLELYSNQDSLVLDFFSGSATTAHAVMKLNAEDGGNRKYICVQLPEETDKKSESYKDGYKNICEIGKERIRRAGKQILAELEEDKDLFSKRESKLDVGFKVLKLDSSNIKKWNAENKIDELDLFKYVDNIEDDRTQEDILYEIILKMGLELTYPIEEIKVSGKTIYTIGFGALMICIDDNVTIEVAERMVKEYKEQNPETWKVVFMDNSFKDDAEKINIIETLKCAGLDEDNFVTI